jgi:hypothetical protein
VARVSARLLAGEQSRVVASEMAAKSRFFPISPLRAGIILYTTRAETSRYESVPLANAVGVRYNGGLTNGFRYPCRSKQVL